MEATTFPCRLLRQHCACTAHVCAQVNAHAAATAPAGAAPPAPKGADEVAAGFLAVANEAMCRPIRALTQMKVELWPVYRLLLKDWLAWDC